MDGLRKNTTKELEAVRALIEKEKLILKKEKKMVKEVKKGQSSRVKLNIGGHKVCHSPQFVAPRCVFCSLLITQRRIRRHTFSVRDVARDADQTRRVDVCRYVQRATPR